VVQRLKQLGDLSRVTADTQPNIVVAGEDIIQDFLAALKLMFTSLTLHTRPKWILKGESLLEFDLGCKAFDIGLVTSVVTSSNRDSLAEKFLDDRDEGLVLGELDTIEGVVRCLHTACERGGVVTLKERHSL